MYAHPFNKVQDCAILYFTVMYCTVLYCTALPCHTILYNTTHTILDSPRPQGRAKQGI